MSEREPALPGGNRAETFWLIQENLFDLAPILVRDLQDRIVRWNRGMEDLYGWTREEANGKVSHDLLRTRFPQPLEQIQAQLAREGRWVGELTHRRRDGGQVVVASQWVLQKDSEGKVAAVLEVNNDITAQKRAEEALRESELRQSEERFRSMVQGVKDYTIFLLDPEGRIVT